MNLGPYYYQRFDLSKEYIILSFLMIFDYIFYHLAQKYPGRTYIHNQFWLPGSGCQDYSSANPDPKEIFTDPQHWPQPGVTSFTNTAFLMF
jgi:hypothetical protein